MAPMFRALIACLLLASIVPLAPLAYASPIDPSYPGGWYDGGDLDDVIDFVTCSVGAIELVPPAVLRPLDIVVSAVSDYTPPPPTSAPRSAVADRAPPLP